MPGAEARLNHMLVLCVIMGSGRRAAHLCIACRTASCSAWVQADRARVQAVQAAGNMQHSHGRPSTPDQGGRRPLGNLVGIVLQLSGQHRTTLVLQLLPPVDTCNSGWQGHGSQSEHLMQEIKAASGGTAPPASAAGGRCNRTGRLRSGGPGSRQVRCPLLTRPLGVELVEGVHRHQLGAVAQLDGCVHRAAHHQGRITQGPLKVPAEVGRRADGRVCMSVRGADGWVGGRVNVAGQGADGRRRVGRVVLLADGVGCLPRVAGAMPHQRDHNRMHAQACKCTHL